MAGGFKTKYEQVELAKVENWKLNTTFYSVVHFLWCSWEKDAKHANGKFVEFVEIVDIVENGKNS